MINIAEKLKNCPVGTKLWTEMFGEVTLVSAGPNIIIKTRSNGEWALDAYGRYYADAGCILWPASGESWDDFHMWDPNALKPYDRVLVLHDKLWKPELLSGYHDGKFYLIGYGYTPFEKVLPYCNETKDLAWTTNLPGSGWKIW